MRKIFLFLALMLFGLQWAQATILTVSNATNLPGNPGQYSTPQAAHDAAYSGDTIMIQGSATSYSDLNITKKIILIGPGYNPIQRENTNAATISNVYLKNGSSNTKIMGLTVTNIYFAYISVAISGIQILRNKVTSQIAFQGSPSALVNNIEIYNNIIASITGSASQIANWNIKNNIIYNSDISTFQVSSITIANNLFINSSGNGLYNLSNVVISNNIFYGKTPYYSNVTLCTFNNNLTYNCTDPTLPYGTNVGSGNKISTDPMFLSVPSTTVTYTYNYRLNSASPAKNAGTDGTDIGLTGGTYPIYQSTTDILTGEPPVPKVTQVTMPATSVPAGGNLQFTVKAKKVN